MEVTPETPDSFTGEYNPISDSAKQAMIQERRGREDDNPEDDMDYERGTGSGSGPKQEENVMENKVIRRIKNVDDSSSGTTPLLGTIQKEEDKTSVVGENTKSVKTD